MAVGAAGSGFRTISTLQSGGKRQEVHAFDSHGAVKLAHAHMGILRRTF